MRRRNPGMPAAPHPGPVKVDDAVWVDFMGAGIVAWYKEQGLLAEHVCKCMRFNDVPSLIFNLNAPKYAGEHHQWFFESDPTGPCRNGFPTSFAWTCKGGSMGSVANGGGDCSDSGECLIFQSGKGHVRMILPTYEGCHDDANLVTTRDQTDQARGSPTGLGSACRSAAEGC